jgi:hypothetical protein
MYHMVERGIINKFTMPYTRNSNLQMAPWAVLGSLDLYSVSIIIQRYEILMDWLNCSASVQLASRLQVFYYKSPCPWRPHCSRLCAPAVTTRPSTTRRVLAPCAILCLALLLPGFEQCALNLASTYAVRSGRLRSFCAMHAQLRRVAHKLCLYICQGAKSVLRKFAYTTNWRGRSGRTEENWCLSRKRLIAYMYSRITRCYKIGRLHSIKRMVVGRELKYAQIRRPMSKRAVT